MAELSPALEEKLEDQGELFDSPVENATKLITTQTLHELRTISLSSYKRYIKKIECSSNKRVTLTS